MNVIAAITLALTASVAAGPAVGQTADPLARVAWLAGCWAAEGKDAGSVEHWLAPAGGTMLGVGRTVKNGKTVEFEFMQLRTNAEGRLVFIAHPSGQSEAEFVMVGGTDGSVTFENPQHDFPQKITYRRMPNGRLVARIEGLRSGVAQGIDFPMKRVACESLGQGR